MPRFEHREKAFAWFGVVQTAVVGLRRSFSLTLWLREVLLPRSPKTLYYELTPLLKGAGMSFVHESRVRIDVYYSPEADSYWAESPDLNGLAASGKTRQEVEREALYAAETLFEIKGIKAQPKLTFRDAEYPPV